MFRVLGEASCGREFLVWGLGKRDMSDLENRFQPF